MRQYIERLRKSLWTIKQPLTRKPALTRTPVSDLFVWRNSEDWETFFELTDISGLFIDGEMASGRYVTILFFDNNGNLFSEKRFDLIQNQRRTLDLSPLLSKSDSTFGTFCVFHSRTPDAVSDLGSFIAERGYLSYRYGRAPLRSYAHGNLDAISLQPSKTTQLLGSSSLRVREYRLQHELFGPALYEAVVVNPSSRDQYLTCKVLSTRTGGISAMQKVQLRPRAAHIFSAQVEQSQTARVVIDSHLVMARPLVFRIQNKKIDVFHG